MPRRSRSTLRPRRSSASASTRAARREVGVREEAQTRQALRNVQEILAKAGATLADVVKVTTFITNRKPGLVAKYDRVIGEFFPNRCPTSTLVEVKSLVLSEMLIEIEAVAVVGAGA